MTSESNLAGQTRRTRLLNLMLGGAMAALWLALIGQQRGPASGLPSELIQSESGAAATAAIALVRSPIAGVIDLYAGEQLVQNMVPVISWQEAGRRYYNNAEIQSASAELVSFAGGYLVDYAAFDQAERVDGALPQPASNVELSLLVRFDQDAVSLQPLLDSNPHDRAVEVGIGHFFGVYHGTSLIEASGTGPMRRIEAMDVPAAGGLMSLGGWRSYPGVQAVTLHSSLPQQPALNLSLDGCPGRLDVEVRDRTWLPQLALDPGLEPWIEAVILYAEPNCYPLRLHLTAR